MTFVTRRALGRAVFVLALAVVLGLVLRHAAGLVVASGEESFAYQVVTMPLWSGGVDLVIALLGVGLLLLCLRLWDWVIGVPFGGLLTVLRADPRALALYLAARITGGALIIGMVLG